MKTIHFLLLTAFFLTVRAASLPAQITQEQANVIVWNHIQDEAS